MPALASQAGLYTAQNQLDDLVYGPSDIAPPQPLVPAGTAAPPTQTLDYPTATGGEAPAGAQYGTPEMAAGYGEQIPSTTPAPAPATAPQGGMLVGEAAATPPPLVGEGAVPATAPPPGRQIGETYPAPAPVGLGYSPPTNTPSATAYPVESYQNESRINQFQAAQAPATAPGVDIERPSPGQDPYGAYASAVPLGQPGTNPTREFGAFEDAPVNADTVQRYEDSIYGNAEQALGGGTLSAHPTINTGNGSGPGNIGYPAGSDSAFGGRGEDPLTATTSPQEQQTNEDFNAALRSGGQLASGFDQWSQDFFQTPQGQVVSQGIQGAAGPGGILGSVRPSVGTGLVDDLLRAAAERGLSPAERYTGAPGFVEPSNPQPRVGSRTATTPDVAPEQMPPRPRPGTVVSETPQRVTVGPLDPIVTGPRQGSITPRNAPPPERATGPVGGEPGGAIPLPAQSGAPRNAPMPEPPPPAGTLSPRAQAALDAAAIGRRTPEQIAESQLTQRVAAPFRPGTEPSPGVVRPQGEPPPIAEPGVAPAAGPPVGRRPILSNRAKVIAGAGAAVGIGAFGQATQTGRMDPSTIPPPVQKTKQPGVIGDPWDGQMVGSTEALPIAVDTLADGTVGQLPPSLPITFADGTVRIADADPAPISQQTYDVLRAQGQEPWTFTPGELSVLKEKGMADDAVVTALIGQSTMVPPGWAEVLHAAEADGTLDADGNRTDGTGTPAEVAGGAAPTVATTPTQVYPVNGSAPQTAAGATAPSTGGGGWVDYGSSGGGRSYGGGGRGYPSTYPSDFGGDEGYDDPWANPIFDRFFATAGGQLTGLRGRTSTKRRRGRPTMNRRSRSGKSQSPMPMPPLHGSDDALAAALALRDR